MAEMMPIMATVIMSSIKVKPCSIPPNFITADFFSGWGLIVTLSVTKTLLLQRWSARFPQTDRPAASDTQVLPAPIVLALRRRWSRQLLACHPANRHRSASGDRSNAPDCRVVLPTSAIGWSSNCFASRRPAPNHRLLLRLSPRPVDSGWHNKYRSFWAPEYWENDVAAP